MPSKAILESNTTPTAKIIAETLRKVDERETAGRHLISDELLEESIRNALNATSSDGRLEESIRAALEGARRGFEVRAILGPEERHSYNLGRTVEDEHSAPICEEMAVPSSPLPYPPTETGWEASTEQSSSASSASSASSTSTEARDNDTAARPKTTTGGHRRPSKPSNKTEETTSTKGFPFKPVSVRRTLEELLIIFKCERKVKGGIEELFMLPEFACRLVWLKNNVGPYEEISRAEAGAVNSLWQQFRSFVQSHIRRNREVCPLQFDFDVEYANRIKALLNDRRPLVVKSPPAFSYDARPLDVLFDGCQSTLPRLLSHFWDTYEDYASDLYVGLYEMTDEDSNPYWRHRVGRYWTGSSAPFANELDAFFRNVEEELGKLDERDRAANVIVMDVSPAMTWKMDDNGNWSIKGDPNVEAKTARPSSSDNPAKPATTAELPAEVAAEVAAGKAAADAEAETTPQENKVDLRKGRRRRNRREARNVGSGITQEEAAEFLTRGGYPIKQSSVSKWDNGVNTPEGYPGRADAVKFQVWANGFLEGHKMKRAVKQRYNDGVDYTGRRTD